jgi:tetratricopeptide (TPR) repeat protein
MPARSVCMVGVTAILLGESLFAQIASDYDDVPLWMRPETVHADNATWPSQATALPVVSSPSSPLSIPDATVSLHELQHQVPGKAAKEFDRAGKATQKGNLQEAIMHLKKAVDIDPEFTDALVNLAATNLMLQHPEAAIPPLESAIKSDPQCTLAYSNLAIAYLMQNKLKDAELAARRNIDLDRSSPRSHLVLALAMVMQDKFTDEVAKLLNKAEQEFPQATLLSARVMAAHGDIAGAKEKLKEYLASNENTGRDLAQDWLNTLSNYERRRGKSATAVALK